MAFDKSIPLDEVRRIAFMARVGFSEEELIKISGELGEILNHFSALDLVDTSGVSVVGIPGEITNVWREDVVKPSLPATVALRNAPEQVKGFFKVGAIQDVEPGKED